MYGHYKVYRKAEDGSVVTVAESTGTELSGEWMNECSLTANFKSHRPIAFKPGDYMEYLGNRYTLEYIPGVTKKAVRDTNMGAFEYNNVKFSNCSKDLANCIVLDIDDRTAENGNIYYSQPKFTMHCNTVEDFMEKLRLNLDRLYGKGVWRVKISENTESATNVDIDIDNKNVLEALAMVSEKFKTGYYVREFTEALSETEPAGKYIIVGDETDISDILRYGKEGKLTKVERRSNADEKIYTRLRAYGSSENMPTNYYSEMYEPIVRIKPRLMWGYMDINGNRIWHSIPNKMTEDPGLMNGFYFAHRATMNKDGDVRLELLKNIGGEDTPLFTTAKQNKEYNPEKHGYPILIPVLSNSNGNGEKCRIRIDSKTKGKKEYEGTMYTAYMYDKFSNDKLTVKQGTGLFLKKEDFLEILKMVFTFYDSISSVAYEEPKELSGDVEYIDITEGLSSLQKESKKNLLVAEKPLSPIGLGVERMMLPWFMWYRALAKDEDGKICDVALNYEVFEKDTDGKYRRKEYIYGSGTDDEAYSTEITEDDGTRHTAESELWTDVYYDGGVDTTRIGEGVVKIRRTSAMTETYGIREGIVNFDNEDGEGKISPTITGLKKEMAEGAGMETDLMPNDNGYLDEIYYATVPDDDGVIYKNASGATETKLTSTFSIFYKTMGFDLKNYASEKDGSIKMTSGGCSGREFTIYSGSYYPRRTKIAVRDHTKTYGSGEGAKEITYKREILTIEDPKTSLRQQRIPVTSGTSDILGETTTTIDLTKYTYTKEDGTKMTYKEAIDTGLFRWVECWEAVCKRCEDSTIGMYFPNRTEGNYISGTLKEMARPDDGFTGVCHSDMFVFMNTTMPSVYIKAWSIRLLEATKEYYDVHCRTNNTFAVETDPIGMMMDYEERGPQSLRMQLKEGRVITVDDQDVDPDGELKNDRWYIKNFSIKEDGNRLPQYSITIAKDAELTTLQKIQGQIVILNRRTTASSNESGGGGTTKIYSSTNISSGNTKVVDNTDSEEVLAALSANQGRVLNGKIDATMVNRYTNIDYISNVTEKQMSVADSEDIYYILLNKDTGNLVAVKASDLEGGSGVISTGIEAYLGWSANTDTQNSKDAVEYKREGDEIHVEGDIWKFNGLSWKRIDGSATDYSGDIEALQTETANIRTEIERLTEGSDAHKTFTKENTELTWTITHGMNKKPAVTLTDQDGNEVECDVKHVSENEITFTFGTPFQGTAILN